MSFILANFVNTTLSAATAAGSTTFTLNSTANLPVLAAGQQMPLTINDAATGLIYEIVYVTAISGSVLTVIRAQEGTSAQNWNIGDAAYCSPTAGTDAVTSISGNIQSAQYITAIDAGVVNAYVGVYTPAITAYKPGTILNIESILATNTGASTINAGAGIIPITSAYGALQGGELFAGTGAILRINAAGTGAELIQTTGGTLPVKAATAAGQAVNLGQGDGRYAAIAGNAGQPFAVAASSGSANYAVPIGQFTTGQVFGTSGINQPIAGGLVLKSGYVAAVGGSFSVVYPAAFPNATVYANYIFSNNNGSADANNPLTATHATGFSGVNWNSPSANLFWFAIGY